MPRCDSLEAFFHSSVPSSCKQPCSSIFARVGEGQNGAKRHDRGDDRGAGVTRDCVVYSSAHASQSRASIAAAVNRRRQRATPVFPALSVTLFFSNRCV